MRTIPSFQDIPWYILYCNNALEPHLFIGDPFKYYKPSLALVARLDLAISAWKVLATILKPGTREASLHFPTVRQSYNLSDNDD